jgi:hypothetical protein
MKIKTDLYCSLASHPLWQQWLKDTDENLYGVFIEKFRASKSCSNNARIMVELLPDIESAGLKDKLMNFLVVNFPNAVIRDDNSEYITSIERYFTSNTFTYPRRTILIADNAEINNLLLKFLDGKIQYEYMLAEGKAYIEYLNVEDIEVQGKIPETKWLLKRIPKKPIRD